MIARKLVVVPSAVPQPRYIEAFHFGAAGCAPIEAGTDILKHHPTVHRDGALYICSVNCSTPPASADMIVDIQVTSNGTDWASVFEDGSVTYPQSQVEPLFVYEFSSAGLTLTTGMWFRMNCSQAGGAEGVMLKLEAQPLAPETESSESDMLLLF